MRIAISPTGSAPPPHFDRCERFAIVAGVGDPGALIADYLAGAPETDDNPCDH
jgi:hypothetical protein